MLNNYSEHPCYAAAGAGRADSDGGVTMDGIDLGGDSPAQVRLLLVLFVVVVMFVLLVVLVICICVISISISIMFAYLPICLFSFRQRADLEMAIGKQTTRTAYEKTRAIQYIRSTEQTPYALVSHFQFQKGML